MSVEFLLTPGFVNGSPIGLFHAAFGISSPLHATGPKSSRTMGIAICGHEFLFIDPPGLVQILLIVCGFGIFGSSSLIFLALVASPQTSKSLRDASMEHTPFRTTG
jgi:hypothetical protein